MAFCRKTALSFCLSKLSQLPMCSRLAITHPPNYCRGSSQRQLIRSSQRGVWTLFRHAQWPPEGTAYGFCALLPLCAQQAKSTGFKASVTITPNSIAAISNRTLKLNLFTIPLITRNHCPGNQLTLLCFCLPPVNLGKPHQTHYYLGN